MKRILRRWVFGWVVAFTLLGSSAFAKKHHGPDASQEFTLSDEKKKIVYQEVFKSNHDHHQFVIKATQKKKVIIKLTDSSKELCLMVEQDSKDLTGDCPVNQWSGNLNAK